jgi:hypothetical protein
LQSSRVITTAVLVLILVTAKAQQTGTPAASGGESDATNSANNPTTPKLTFEARDYWMPRVSGLGGRGGSNGLQLPVSHPLSVLERPDAALTINHRQLKRISNGLTETNYLRPAHSIPESPRSATNLYLIPRVARWHILFPIRRPTRCVLL